MVPNDPHMGSAIPNASVFIAAVHHYHNHHHFFLRTLLLHRRRCHFRSSIYTRYQFPDIDPFDSLGSFAFSLLSITSETFSPRARPRPHLIIPYSTYTYPNLTVPCHIPTIQYSSVYIFLFLLLRFHSHLLFHISFLIYISLSPYPPWCCVLSSPRCDDWISLLFSLFCSG
jgi:hypothetical protein